MKKRFDLNEIWVRFLAGVYYLFDIFLEILEISDKNLDIKHDRFLFYIFTNLLFFDFFFFQIRFRRALINCPE